MSNMQPQAMPRQHMRMRSAWVGGIILTVVLAVLAFVFSPHMPLGKFWAPAAGMPKPVGIQIPLLILLNIFEAITFGLGVSFLVFGWSYVTSISPVSRALTIASYLSAVWLLMSWWPHDSLHLHIGELSLSNLLLVEYGFHVTGMIAAVILMSFFVALLRRRNMPER